MVNAPVRFGRVALDLLRAVDRVRLVRKLGDLSPEEATRVLLCLGEMFAG